jgi:hypothetical protein
LSMLTSTRRTYARKQKTNSSWSMFVRLTAVASTIFNYSVTAIILKILFCLNLSSDLTMWVYTCTVYTMFRWRTGSCWRWSCSNHSYPCSWEGPYQTICGCCCCTYLGWTPSHCIWPRFWYGNKVLNLRLLVLMVLRIFAIEYFYRHSRVLSSVQLCLCSNQVEAGHSFCWVYFKIIV